MRHVSKGLAVGLGLAAFACGPALAAGAIDHIKADKTVRIAFRPDAAPFSSSDGKSDPKGFMVDLCRAVVKELGGQLGTGDLKIAYVQVSATDRFDAIAGGKADMLCEPTTETLGRREKVDFSIGTFVDGASLLAGASAPPDLKALGGKKVGVLGGTTTEGELRNGLKASNIAADVVLAKTHEDGLKMLEAGDIAAYFADRSILMFLWQKSSAPDKLHLAENYLSVEPYALALPRGDEDFRLAVDKALSHIYRAGGVAKIFADNFGAKAQPSDTLKLFYGVTALPD